MFTLSGDLAITYSLMIHSNSKTLSHSSLVAVAVKAITLILFAIKLLISPILAKHSLKTQSPKIILI